MRSFWRACRLLMTAVAAASLSGAPAHAWTPDTSAQQTSPSIAEADRIFAEAAKRAEALAKRPYSAPARDLPAPFANLDYDGYRKLRAMPDHTVWGEAGNTFGFLPLPRGGLYQEKLNLF